MISLLVLLLSNFILGSLSSNIFPSELRRTECGGSLKADKNSLFYPGVRGEELIPGETCVWTIHLETTRDFRISISDLDLNGSNSSCDDGALRLYSLSNFAPPDRIEEYTFCSENAPGDHFYLTGNVAVLVLYVSPSNTQPGKGFTINWEGNILDHLQTKHLAAYSQIDRGLISYPGVGTYESALAATWLISTEGKSDLELTQLRIEDCPNSNSCTCEAFIIYEINSFGILTETTRYCSNVTSPAVTSNLPNSFLLSFFTDASVPPNGATGFSVLYFPSGVTSGPSTTTSEPSTTTSEPSTTTSGPSTTTSEPSTTTSELTTTTEAITTSTTIKTPVDCGGKLTSSSGAIDHNLNSLYSPNERCVWIISPENAATFEIFVFNNKTKPFGDGLVVTGIHRGPGETLMRNHFMNFEGSNITRINANILVVTFFSDSSLQEYGFRLEYEVKATVTVPAPTVELISSAYELPNKERLSFPEGEGVYENNALAIFVYSPAFSAVPEDYKAYIHITDFSLQDCACCDEVTVFDFSPEIGWDYYLVYLCGQHRDNYNATATDMLMITFTSDWNQASTGFNMDFCIRPS